MVISQNPNVYMETMEEAPNEGEKPAENGSAGRLGMAGNSRNSILSFLGAFLGLVGSVYFYIFHLRAELFESSLSVCVFITLLFKTFIL